MSFISWLALLGKTESQTQRKTKQNQFTSFIFRRPYKIILQRNKNNEMKVMEQCIESGTLKFLFVQKTRTLNPLYNCYIASIAYVFFFMWNAYRARLISILAYFGFILFDYDGIFSELQSPS